MVEIFENYLPVQMNDQVIDLDSGWGHDIGICKSADYGLAVRTFVGSGSDFHVALPDRQLNSPMIRLFPNGDLLIGVSYIDETGASLQRWRSFSPQGKMCAELTLGNDILEVKISELYILVAYGEEGIFGGCGPSNEILSAFSHAGKFEFGYRTRMGDCALSQFNLYDFALVGS